MPIIQRWIATGSKAPGRYALHSLGSVVGIVALTVTLAAAGSLLSVRFPQLPSLLPLVFCLGASALGIALAVRAGHKNLRNATVFFLTEENRLFLLDTRWLVRYKQGFLGFAEAALAIDRLLQQMAATERLPAQAEEILRIEQLRETDDAYLLRCQIRSARGRVKRCTRFLVKGYENETALLRQLERRKAWQTGLETPPNHNPLGIAVSLLALVLFAALCALSHPAVARLPQRWYFPSMGAAYAALFSLLLFALRQHRGE